MCLTIGQELHFDGFEGTGDIVGVAQEGRDHHGCAVLPRNAKRMQIESRQHIGRQPGGDQLIQHCDRDVERRQEGEQQDQPQRRARLWLDDQHHGQRGEDRAHHQSAHKHHVRMHPHRALHTLAERRCVPRGAFELA